MKKNIKSFVLNMHVGSAVSVLFICLSLLSDWFGDDDDNDTHLGNVYADHLDTPWELVFAPDGGDPIAQDDRIIIFTRDEIRKLE